MNTGVKEAVERIDGVRHRMGRRRAALVAVSGIDASGKGYLSCELAKGLCMRQTSSFTTTIRR